MKRRFAPPTSSRNVFTLDSSSSLFDWLSTDPVIGVTRKSRISRATCSDAAEAWSTKTATATPANRDVVFMQGIIHTCRAARPRILLWQSQQRRRILFRHQAKLRVGEAARPK